jgi:surface antigen
MNKVITIMTVALTSAGLAISGCTPGNNVPGSTAAGAVAGGLAGGLLFKGSPAGIIGGALLGGIVGNAIGNQMDARDRAYMQNAIIVTPVHETVVWTNEDTGVIYRVTPTRVYYTSGRTCREYTTRAYVNGHWRVSSGRVCQYPGETWRVVEY